MAWYTISDIHGRLPEIPEDCTVLFIIGDICPDYSQSEEQRQRHWLNTKMREWLEEANQKNIQIFATWGNHDRVGMRSFLVPDDLPWTLLVDKETTFYDETLNKKFVVYGMPWIPLMNSWPFYADNKTLKEKVSLIPSYADIILAHAPPYNYSDRSHGHHYGNHFLTERLLNDKEIDWKMILCGHVHEGRGKYVCDTNTGKEIHVINCCAKQPYFDEIYREPFIEITTDLI